jgi:hypothetical protein
MSLVVVEQIGSRQVSRSQGKLTGSRSFHVYDDTTAIETPNQIARLFGSGGLPYFGEPFPGTTNLGAIDWNISKVDGHIGLWKVVWDYQEVVGGFTTTPPPDEIVDAATPGFIEVTASFTASHHPIWRAFTTSQIASLCLNTSTLCPLGVPTAADIGGVHVDSAGEPVSFIFRQFQITITTVREGRFKPRNFVPFLWTRNNREFLDCEPGSLLYTGCSVNRIGERKYQLGHAFVYDQFFHMHQSVGRDAGGKVLLRPHPTAPGIKVAEYVRFVQPYPDLADLRGMDSQFYSI